MLSKETLECIANVLEMELQQGKRNSVDVGRKGFEELYMYSPGSAHEWYGEYCYVCVGQAAMLKPIRLGPGGVWRGEQQLHNPNI